MYEFAGPLLVRLLAPKPVPQRPTLAEEDAYYANYREAPWQRLRHIFTRLSGREKTAATNLDEEDPRASRGRLPARTWRTGKVIPSGECETAVPRDLKGKHGEGRQNAAGGKAEHGRAPEKGAAVVTRPGDGDCTCSAI